MKIKDGAIKPCMVIHCPKEEDAIELARKLIASSNAMARYWNHYRDETCFYILPNMDVNYGKEQYYRVNGHGITEFSDLIEPEPRFKVGDKVRVRSDLKVGEMYGELTLWEGDMSSYKGTTHTIGEIDGDKIRFQDDGTYKWSAEMIEPVDDSSTEMSAVEVLEWLSDHYNDYNGKLFTEVFGADYTFYELLIEKKLSPMEIVQKITAYEAAKKEAPKPIKIEWVDVCRVIQIRDDGIKAVVHEEDLTSDRSMLESEEILKKYVSEHEGNYFMVIENVCRVKEDES